MSNNTITIPLPPGMTPAQFSSLQGSIVTIAITVAVAFAVLLWDYCNLLPDEVKLYQTTGKDVWKTPAPWAFVLLRYSGILATFPSLFFTSIQSNYCQVAVVLSQVGVVLVIASSGIIFACRVTAIWSSNRVVMGAIGLMYLVMLGCWIAVATQYKAVTGAPTSFGSNCQMDPIVSWAPISYASSVAFDAVVLAFTLFKIGSESRQQSRIGYVIYRDSLGYFLITAVTNITVLSIQALGSSHDLIKPTAVPFSTLITVTMGSRVFLNLRLFNQRQERVNRGLPTTSQSSSHVTGNLTFNAPPPPTIALQPITGEKKVDPYNTFPPPPMRTSGVSGYSQSSHVANKDSFGADFVTPRAGQWS